MTSAEIKRAARMDPETELRPERFGALAYDFGTRRLSIVRRRAEATRALNDELEAGLDAPICLTWELTYACNLACVHCLSSSGRRDPRELTTAECKGIIDELERMQVFYVNIGGGEPTVRRDFWELLDYAVAHRVGVKFSTNGSRITPEIAARIATTDYVDVQVSLDGATAQVNDRVRGPGSYATAIRAMENLAAAGFAAFKLSVVVTRENVTQLDAFKALADRYDAQLRLT
ncbi:MAG: mycofactocin radical SAM maturase, partial [Solirubrobacterales bacterium]|nr:mycofactocin radical SAM maturase [Solirubrobacterales bacterium]